RDAQYEPHEDETDGDFENFLQVHDILLDFSGLDGIEQFKYIEKDNLMQGLYASNSQYEPCHCETAFFRRSNPPF
ncbi:MAG: hypothetical protein Q8N45_04550, partial [Anaerolineales bacterium]|nr:hypothetical protein [Anaerolineales bacterium]